MTKMTIGVYKSNKNAGRLRFHRKNTKKVWKHFFLDEDDTFQTEYVSAFKAMILKRNQQYKKIFVCTECFGRFTAYVPKKATTIDIKCPVCGEE